MLSTSAEKFRARPVIKASNAVKRATEKINRMRQRRLETEGPRNVIFNQTDGRARARRLGRKILGEPVTLVEVLAPEEKKEVDWCNPYEELACQF